MNSREKFNLIKDLGLLDIVSLADDTMNCYHASRDDKYLSEYNDLKRQFDFYDLPFSFDDARRVIYSTLRNKAKVVTRVEDRIKYILSKVDDSNKAYFITLTFDDDYLDNNTSVSNIRRNIRIFLNSFCDVFVANKDFGKLHDRLHFHGVVLLSKKELEFFIVDYVSTYGFCYLELIDDKSRAISKYITKLSYHAVKDSTRPLARENLIYSRLK